MRKAVKATVSDQAAWPGVQAELQERLNAGTYGTWFKPSRYLGATGTTHFLWVPNSFFYHWIRTHHAKLLAKVFRNHFPEGGELKLVCPGVKP